MNAIDIRKLTDITLKQFNDVYGDFDPDESWLFLVSDYFATGEGRTISILITQGEASCKEDENESKQFLAIKEFIELHGDYYGSFIDFLPKQVMFEQYANCIPSFIKGFGHKCYYSFYSQIHFNAS